MFHDTIIYYKFNISFFNLSNYMNYLEYLRVKEVIKEMTYIVFRQLNNYIFHNKIKN